MRIEPQEIEQVNKRFAHAEPQEILRWAWDRFGGSLGATSSFQSQSVPLLHMIATTTPDMPVYFLDTGFHFKETLEFRDQLVEAFGLWVHNLRGTAKNEAYRQYFPDMYNLDPDFCCAIHKVAPLKSAKQGFAAWISGIRRDQTENRRNTPVIGVDKTGQYKIAPLANWTSQDVWRYSSQYDLPMHPLAKEGYMSIGCAPCTRPINAGEDERAGRWAGKDKVECGIHTTLGVIEYHL